MKYAIVLIAAIVASASAWPTKGGFEMPVQSTSQELLKTEHVEQPLQKLFYSAPIQQHFETRATQQVLHQMPVKGRLFEQAPLKRTYNYRVATSVAAPIKGSNFAPLTQSVDQLQAAPTKGAISYIQAQAPAVEMPAQSLSTPVVSAPVKGSSFAQSADQLQAAPVKGSSSYIQAQAPALELQTQTLSTPAVSAPIKGSHFYQQAAPALESVQAPVQSVSAPVESVQAPVQTVASQELSAPVKGSSSFAPLSQSVDQLQAAPVKGSSSYIPAQAPALELPAQSISTPVVSAPIKGSHFVQQAAPALESVQAPVQSVSAPVESVQAPVQTAASQELAAPVKGASFAHLGQTVDQVQATPIKGSI